VDVLARQAIGAAIEVHRILGPGFSESVYESALCHELQLRGVPFERQSLAQVRYKDAEAGEYRLDILVGGSLVVELKAVERLLPVHSSQLIAYLKASNRKLGLLINFNVPRLKQGIKRIVVS